jgi:hypothetical protein
MFPDPESSFSTNFCFFIGIILSPIYHTCGINGCEARLAGVRSTPDMGTFNELNTRSCRLGSRERDENGLRGKTPNQ